MKSSRAQSLGSFLLMPLTCKAMILVIVGTVTVIGSPRTAPEVLTLSASDPTIPVQTDDGSDPITLIFTGYAPSWSVASNIAGWSDSAYCSGPKTLNGNSYNYTLEHPDPTGVPCFGPRDHVRIWDMGYSPIFGQWSIGAAHHEHTVCDPVCHHVVDSWEKAEADVRSAFVGGQAYLSISNYTLGNAGYYQGVFNDGNATLFQLKRPAARYPVIFNENGLSNGTSWSVTMNGTTVTSAQPDIPFSESNGTYLFTIARPSGFDVSPPSGTITVRGESVSQIILFRPPWSTSSATVFAKDGNPISIGFSGNATVSTTSVRLAATGNTDVSFTATEIGARGVLNVTIPRSNVPSGSSALVYVDRVRNENTKITGDMSHYYIYFFLSYGTHLVELQFVPSAPPYLEYIVGGAFAAGILGIIFMIFKSKKAKGKIGDRFDRSWRTAGFH